MDEDIYDDLWEMEWIRISNAPYVLKFKFEEDGYKILISDLSEIYGEKLVENEVQERFCILNPYAEMKSKVILTHVKESLEDSLKSKVELQCTTEAITIRLKFTVSGLIFIFDIKPQLLPCEKLRAHLIAPTVLAALSVHQENVLLKQKIKDWEKDKSVLSMRKVKEDHTRTLGSLKLQKRSKILVTDVLTSFLSLQKTIQGCISESKALPDIDCTTSSSISHPLKSNIDHLKETVKEEIYIEPSLKFEYEDMQDPSTFFPSDVLQESEISSLSVKREIDDSSISASDSSLQTKLKKKKCLKF